MLHKFPVLKLLPFRHHRHCRRPSLEKLEQAQRESARKQRTLLLAVLGIAVFVGMAALTMTLYREVTDLREGSASARDTIPPQPALPAPRGGGDVSGTQPTPSVQVPGSETAAVPPPPPLPSTEPTGGKLLPPTQAEVDPPGRRQESAASPAVDSKQIEGFKAAFKRYEEELAPKIESESFGKWRPEIQRDVRFLKDKAFGLYGRGQLDEALQSIAKASHLAERNIAEKAAEFEQAMVNASTAFSADNYEAAKPYVDRALQLEQESEAAKKLAAEIDKLPAIINHLEAARVARSENRIDKEHKALEQVLALAPERTKWRDRLNELRHQMAERQFAMHIRIGLAQVEKRRLKDAAENLAAARRLFPKREETAYLQKQIVELDRELKVEALTAAAKMSMQNDDWPRTMDFFQKAKKIQPGNQYVIDGHALSLRVLSLRREIQTHLDAPQRLSSMNVAESVVALIKRADTLSGVSRSLDARKSDLAMLLVSYSVPIPVTVVSDGATFVSVRSVGRVGTIKQKVINLRPGSYLFEGTRPGYKSKLLSVEIPPNTPKVTVEISCDEQI